MSIFTPPATSHRGKENRFTTHVAWSPQNQYHTVTAGSPPKVPAISSASKYIPPKSILKKRTQVLLPLPDDNKREITPEPSDPLADLKYLEYPVSKIVAPDSSLRELIEAYSVLGARLKRSVNGRTNADASWPLFQPLRKQREALVEAIIRDLTRALVDPLKMQQHPTEVAAEAIPAKVCLPSPKDSPRKKQGMTAEQVKYARDLCTTCHAVIRLLAAAFDLPAVYRVFSGM
jgi:hypothetical protein